MLHVYVIDIALILIIICKRTISKCLQSKFFHRNEIKYEDFARV